MKEFMAVAVVDFYNEVTEKQYTTCEQLCQVKTYTLRYIYDI